jgi:thioester reductase-like protein
MSVLLTGATGFVGMEVLARLVRDGDEPVYALVRGRDRADAERRLAGVLDGLGLDGEQRGRVRAVAGELTAPGLGMAASDTLRLLDEVTDVVHCAASVSFAMPMDEAREINVHGTRRILDLAERIAVRRGLRRFVHVSTAYVCGRHRGVYTESDLWTGQDFRNSYERSKAEAEQLVHRRGERFPAVVVRPSIVVGDSATGWTPTFNVLYWPLRAFARGLLGAIPARPDGRVDVVPVDYVADAIVHVLRERPDVRGVLNATAGADALTVDRLVEIACTALGRERPTLESPDGGLAERSSEAARYLPYFDMEVVFDDARAREVLRPAGIAAPPLESYFETLLDFASRAKWGKAPITRAAAVSPLPLPGTVAA